MEESWASKNKRQREYFHHVVNLDKIYSQDQQRKKIEETIQFMKRISTNRQSTLVNERSAANKSIEQENNQQEKKIKESGDHYTKFVLRPQIGLIEHSLAYGGIGTSTINHFEVQRTHQQKRIDLENKRIGQRLHFITSSFTQESLKRKTNVHRSFKDLSKSKKTVDELGGYMNLDRIGVSPQFKNRTLKGFTFKSSPDKLSLMIGQEVSKEDIENMLGALEKKKKAYYDQFKPAVWRMEGSKGGISKSSFAQSQVLPDVITPSSRSVNHFSKDDTKKSTADLASITQHSKELKRKGEEERAYIKRRLQEEEENSRQEFKVLASHLFAEEVAGTKMIVFNFEVKSTEPFTNFFVAANNITSFVNIGKKGSISIPWKSVFNDTIIELEFMTQQGKSERVAFDISKRNPRLGLTTLTGYQLTASVHIN